MINPIQYTNISKVLLDAALEFTSSTSHPHNTPSKIIVSELIYSTIPKDLFTTLFPNIEVKFWAGSKPPPGRKGFLTLEFFWFELCTQSLTLNGTVSIENRQSKTYSLELSTISTVPKYAPGQKVRILPPTSFVKEVWDIVSIEIGPTGQIWYNINRILPFYETSVKESELTLVPEPSKILYQVGDQVALKQPFGPAEEGDNVWIVDSLESARSGLQWYHISNPRLGKRTTLGGELIHIYKKPLTSAKYIASLLTS